MEWAIWVIVLTSLVPFSAERVEIIKEDGASIVYLRDNVVIEQESTIITCREARLNETEGWVSLIDSVKIKNPDGEIRAHNALYYFDTKIGFLMGGVTFFRQGQFIFGDSLKYDGTKKIVEMFRNVKIDDRKNRETAYGGEGWYDIDAEKGLLKKNPYLEIQREDKTPMLVYAQEFLLLNKEGKFYGYDSVKGLIDSIIIFCDTMEFNFNKDLGILKRPLVIEKNNQLKGDSGEFYLDKEKIEYFRVYNGVGDYWTKEGNYNIVSGDTITVLFNDGRAFQVVVEGNPKGMLNLKKKEDAGD